MCAYVVAQVKLGQCTAMGGDMPEAVALLRPLLAEHEAQFADLFVEVGDFLLLRGEAAEVRALRAAQRSVHPPPLEVGVTLFTACDTADVQA